MVSVLHLGETKQRDTVRALYPSIFPRSGPPVINRRLAVGVYPVFASFDNVIFAIPSRRPVAHPLRLVIQGACETFVRWSSTRSLGDARSRAGKAFQVLALDCAGDSGIISNIRTSCSKKAEVIASWDNVQASE